MESVTPSGNEAEHTAPRVRLDKPHTVLVVEDEKSTREVLGMLLDAEGFRVVSAANGMEAVRYLVAAPELPAVIVLDLLMPVMSGTDLLHWLAEDERFSFIPVLIVTAAPFPAELLGPHHVVLTKPVDVPELMDAVEACARRQDTSEPQ